MCVFVCVSDSKTNKSVLYTKHTARYDAVGQVRVHVPGTSTAAAYQAQYGE